MADSIKVQGSARQCIDSLRYYSNLYNVIYDVFIGHSPTNFKDTCIKIRPTNSQRESETIIPIQLMWRSSYNEYDNSL
jgi:hypothetical protein